MRICTFTTPTVLVKQLEAFKDKNHYKEFLEVTVSLSLHINSISICQVLR